MKKEGRMKREPQVFGCHQQCSFCFDGRLNIDLAHPPPESLQVRAGVLSPLCFCFMRQMEVQLCPRVWYISHRRGLPQQRSTKCFYCMSVSNTAILVAVRFLTTSISNHHLHLETERNHQTARPNTACCEASPHHVNVAFFACTHVASANFACSLQKM